MAKLLTTRKSIKEKPLIFTSFPDCRPDVLPHRLPAAHPGRQQLRVGRTDSAGASPDAASLFGGRGRQPSPSSLPAAGARQGGLPGRAAHPTDGSHFLRYPEPSRVRWGNII